MLASRSLCRHDPPCSISSWPPASAVSISAMDLNPAWTKPTSAIDCRTGSGRERALTSSQPASISPPRCHTREHASRYSASRSLMASERFLEPTFSFTLPYLVSVITLRGHLHASLNASAGSTRGRRIVTIDNGHVSKESLGSCESTTNPNTRLCTTEKHRPISRSAPMGRLSRLRP